MTKALNTCSSHQLLGIKNPQQNSLSPSKVLMSSAAEFLIRKFKSKLILSLKRTLSLRHLRMNSIYSTKDTREFDQENTTEEHTSIEEFGSAQKQLTQKESCISREDQQRP